MMTRTTKMLLLCAWIALVAACGRQAHSSENAQQDDSTTDTPSVPPQPSDVLPPFNPSVSPGATDAIQRISQGLCTRALRCGNVGNRLEYSSLEDCETRTRGDWKEDFVAYQCPDGIVSKQLEACLKALEDVPCRDPLDSLGRIVACRAADICEAASPTPGVSD